MTELAFVSPTTHDLLRLWNRYRITGIVLIYGALAALLATPMLVAVVPLGVDVSTT
jgi:hypothetical protein